MLRLTSGKYSEAGDASLVDVLHQSDNFIVVNKRYDLKVNSDDDNEVTVASTLLRLYPSLIDECTSHGFRFDKVNNYLHQVNIGDKTFTRCASAYLWFSVCVCACSGAGMTS